MPTISDINEALSNVFNLFNEHFYNGELPEPVLTAQTNMHSPRTAGWCTIHKVWKDERYGAKYYEITISSEFLYRDAVYVCGVLLHEMVHLYCLEHGIKDTSRSDTYHNKRFKEVAEAHGLISEYSKQSGWSITSPTDETVGLINRSVEPDAFYLTRLKHRTTDPNDDSPNEEESGDTDSETDKKKSSTRRYICTKCDTIIRATRIVNVICGDCNHIFELMD